MTKKYKTPEGGRIILDTYDKLLGEWGVPVSEEDIMTPYGSTHLVLAGDPAAPPLVLFHGVGDDSALMWLENAKELSERFHLIAVDTMGGPGKSEPNEEYYKTFNELVWLDAIMAAKELKQFYTAGVSNGSYLAQFYTANRPESVLKAVAMAGGIALKGRRSPIFRMMKVFLPEALFPTPKNARRLMGKMCGSQTSLDRVIAAHPVMMEHWIGLMKYYNNQMMFYHKHTGFDEAQIDILRDKTRILIGALDGLAAGSDAYDLLKRYNMNHRVVEDAGHALNMEKPELANREIIDFLLGG